MTTDADLQDLFISLQETNEKILEQALDNVLRLCDCGITSDLSCKESCRLATFVLQSPYCVELFHIWACLDKSLSSILCDAGILDNSRTFSLNQANSITHDTKTITQVKARLASRMASCFALVLQHRMLDDFALITQESRYIVASRIVQFCMRSLYRLLHWIHSTTKDFFGVCWLLKTITLVSDSVTGQFLATFNFRHPIFQTFLTLPSCSLNQLRKALREGRNPFAFGVLGSYSAPSFVAQYKLRSELIMLFLQCMNSSHAIQMMTKKRFISQILGYLSWDTIQHCKEIISLLSTKICEAPTMPRRSKLFFFSLDTLIRLGAVYSLYMTVVDEWLESSCQESVFREKLNLALATLHSLESLLRSVCCEGNIIVSKCPFSSKIILQYSSWLQLLFFPQQQEFFSDLLKQHQHLALSMFEALNSDAGHQQLCIPSSVQPRLCALWIRYVLLAVRLLSIDFHPQSMGQSLTFNSLFVTQIDRNMLDEATDLLSQKPLDICESPQSNTLGSILPPFYAKLYSLSSDVAIESWIESQEILEDTDALKVELTQLLFAGCSRLINPNVLTSMILHQSPCIVFLGLGLILCTLARLARYKASFCCSKTFETYLNNFFVSQLPDLATLVQVYPRFCGRGASRFTLEYNWNYTSSLQDMTVSFDIKQTKVNIQLDEDLEVPNVHFTEADKLQGHHEDGGLQTRTFVLTNMLNEFENLLVRNDSSFFGLHELFPRWCLVLERMFSELSLDHSMTKFDWSQLLNVSFVQFRKSQHETTENDISVVQRQLCVLKLLDAAWNLNCLSGDCIKVWCFDEMSPLYMKAYLTWFEHLVRLWRSIPLNFNATASLEKLFLKKPLPIAVTTFLKRTGVFAYGLNQNDAEAWVKILNKKDMKWPTQKEVWLDFFLFTLRITWTHFGLIYSIYEQALLCWMETQCGVSCGFSVSFYTVTFVINLFKVLFDKSGEGKPFTSNDFSGLQQLYATWPKCPVGCQSSLLEFCEVMCEVLENVAKVSGQEYCSCLRFLLLCERWHGFYWTSGFKATSGEAREGHIEVIYSTLYHLEASLLEISSQINSVQTCAEKVHLNKSRKSSPNQIDEANSVVVAPICSDISDLPLHDCRSSCFLKNFNDERLHQAGVAMMHSLKELGIIQFLAKERCSILQEISWILRTVLEREFFDDFFNSKYSRTTLDSVESFCMELSSLHCSKEPLCSDEALIEFVQSYINLMDLNVTVYNSKKLTSKQTSKWSRARNHSLERFKLFLESFADSLWIRSLFESLFVQHHTTSALCSGPLTSQQIALLRLLVSLEYSRHHLLEKKGKEDSNLDYLGCISKEWVRCLVTRYYFGSMMESDQLIRFLIQSPLKFSTVTLEEWVGKHYGYLEPQCCLSDINSVSLRSVEMNWLSLSVPRRNLTLENFPFTRTFLPYTQHRHIPIHKLTELYSVEDWSHSTAVRQRIPFLQYCSTNVENHSTLFSWFMYDPAYLFPFLLGRFRMAWYVIHEKRGSLGNMLPMESLSDVTSIMSCSDENTDSAHDIDAYTQHLKIFSLPLDAEGVWLRRIASGGVLELLLMGLGCSDPLLRTAAQQCLSLYRDLLLLSVEDARKRALRHRRKKAWKRAVRECRNEARITQSLGRRKARNQHLSKETVCARLKHIIVEEPLAIQYSFKELQEILTLLNLVKNALVPCSTEAIAALPTPVAAFASSCIPILLECSHPMYPLINKYLLSRFFLVIDNIPMFLTNYWSPRANSWHQEIRFAFLVISKALGSSFVKTSQQEECHVENVWICMNKVGGIISLVNSVVEIHVEYSTLGLEQLNSICFLWDIVIKVLLRLTRNPKYLMWLIKQYGLLEWVDYHFRKLHKECIGFESGVDSEDLSKEDIAQICRLVLHRLISLAVLVNHIKHVIQTNKKLNMNETLPTSFVPSAEEEDDNPFEYLSSFEYPTDPLCVLNFLNYILEWMGFCREPFCRKSFLECHLKDLPVWEQIYILDNRIV